jgi:signal transduction histidine kinase
MATELDKERMERSLTDQIVLGVAHELNNPNTFIRVNSLNLKKMLNLLGPALLEYERQHPERKFGPFTLGQLRAKMVQLNESTLQATVRIIAVADKLKQAVAASLEASDVLDLRDVVGSVSRMHDFLFRRIAKVEVQFAAEGPYPVMGHLMQLEQAFSVLVTNATDAIEARHREKQGEEGELLILVEEKGEEILLHFRDNGCGMSTTTLKKIFDPYFTTKPQGVGDGLGLALCRAILDRHAGEISVTSSENEGSQFVVSLPKATKEAVNGTQ